MFLTKFLFFLKERFPENRKQWNLYFLVALPVVGAGVIFALNTFVDNFMVTHLKGAVAALGYAAIWTGLFINTLFGINVITSAIFAQYYGKKDKTNYRAIQSLRFLISLLVGFIFAFFTWIIPQQMIEVFARDNSKKYIVDLAVDYISLVGFSWILIAWSMANGNTLRETGLGMKSLISAIVSTVFHIVGNAICLYVFNLGVKSVAIISILTRIISISINIYFNNKYIPHIHIWPWQIFKLNKITAKKVLVRLPWILVIVLGLWFVNFRAYFWTQAYNDQNPIGNPVYHISAISVLGFASSIFSIFMSSTNSITANTIKFVGKKLGGNKIKEAQKNSKELIGFHFVLALLLSVILIIIASMVPYLYFFGNGIAKGVDNALNTDGSFTEQAIAARTEFLLQIRNACYVLALFSIMWITFISLKASIEAGGFAYATSILEFVVGLIQIGWLALLTFIIIPQYNISFIQSYILFYVSDILKTIGYEILYSKVNWAKNITINNKVLKQPQQNKVFPTNK